MADFFLEPDDAKTFGDIDYMRKAKRVRRTFPKTVSQPEAQELNIQVSASVFRDEKAKAQFAAAFDPTTFGEPTGSNGSNSNNGNSATPSGFEVKPDAATTRRKADSSMDMFRNMAKDIKK